MCCLCKCVHVCVSEVVYLSERVVHDVCVRDYTCVRVNCFWYGTNDVGMLLNGI